MMEIYSRMVKTFLTDVTLGMVILLKDFPLNTGHKLSIHKLFTRGLIYAQFTSLLLTNLPKL